MPFSDLALSRRLERAEGHACTEYAEARRRLYPHSGAAWIECAGAYAVFDGVESPLTQSSGLGIFEELSPASLDVIERFFLDRAAPVLHEVSPSASHISVRLIGPDEAPRWADVSARSWAHEHPELLDFLLQLGAISTARKHGLCFLAEADSKPGAAGVLCLHHKVALFGGSATIPELRRHGLQTALLQERMRYAFDHGCDLAMMVAVPGSDSQRNAERKGFQIAYTRTKWKLCS
jgi:GNAT superfamily N-acetyltransferase